MTTNQFTHGNRTYLFVEVPEGAKDVDIVGDEISYMLFNYAMQEDWEYNIDLPKGDWKIVGIVKDFGELDCKPLVMSINTGHIYRGKYVDWNLYYDYEKEDYVFESSKDSFHSLIRSNGLHVENPYGNLILQDSDAGSDLEIETYPLWQKAQQKTVGNTLLIIKENK